RQGILPQSDPGQLPAARRAALVPPVAAGELLMVAATPGRGRLRRGVAVFHRWLGLALGAFVVFVGLTGSLIVFQPEIDRWLNPGLHFPGLHFVEQAAGQPPGNVALEAIAATAIAAHPWGAPSFVNLRLPRAPG